MSIWWSLHLRREAASVPLARRLLLGTMETAGVDPDVSYDLSVALSEACANAVEHGGDQGAGEASAAYRVTAYLDGETCRIEVADSGPGFPARRGGQCAHTAAQSAAMAATTATAATTSTPTTAAVAAIAEGGRGLCLIEQLADHVHFRNRPGHGAVVSFDKILKWREDAPLVAS
ncbi:ATP-binding protein [Streptomyces sp. NBC_01142]|uniref:ATP-binding protein n=1 Tax=Streptomyces sp. NBC_01142 TaxID=2975865 RepID=UPI0022500D53|nr:ATP-binding protein [Streptomyces sp. NBC_01142]MCX4824283.1 ATP-binding protein [Streptomyces sp. NBC_01142]